MELFEDFRDLLVALADAQAAFVVVGGHAVGRAQDLADVEALQRIPAR